jgi:N-acetylglucosaminyldiphosphoundecaprenol N-acetyl-beta-D-mannosaminyltransferase
VFINFFGIKFINISESILLSNFKPGLYVFPSAPGLAMLDKNKEYLKSLKNANYVFFDSGYFVLLLKFVKKINVKKFSGFKFINFLIKYLKKNHQKIFIIDSDKNSASTNKEFFKKEKICVIDNYISPLYSKKKIEDKDLLKKIIHLKPKYILINLGGGVQELLGSYLFKNCNYKPYIICTGAALSFITKTQAPINNLIDNLYLGWLLRCIFNPFIFIKRYFISLRLIKIVFKTKVILEK